jgi:hypothetical protein
MVEASGTPEMGLIRPHLILPEPKVKLFSVVVVHSLVARLLILDSQVNGLL